MAVGEMSPENENNSQLSSQQAKQASPRIRKQDSYLKAIGNKSHLSHLTLLSHLTTLSYLTTLSRLTPSVTYDILSYIFETLSHLTFMSHFSLGNNEDELSPLPRRVGVKKQESYQRAILKGGVGSFSGSFNAGESTDRPPGMLLRQEALDQIA